MATNTYDPTKITLVFAGFEIYGYADGTFISVDKAEDAYSFKVGATGHGTRVRSRNSSGSVTVTLEASSGCNDLLSAVHTADLLSNAAVLPLIMKEGNGTTVVGAPESWIVKISPVEYAKDSSTREWVIYCSDMKVFSGGLSSSIL